MKDFESILLSQLRDIHGLQNVSIWPLAAGWWLMIFLTTCAVFVIFMKMMRIKKYKKSWRYKLEQELNAIAESQDASRAKENISRINDILKRISIKLYGRKDSASLTGKKWLAWLSNRDPDNFNWLKKGGILIEYPYMKEENIQANHEQIAIIAKALKPWLKL